MNPLLRIRLHMVGFPFFFMAVCLIAGIASGNLVLAIVVGVLLSVGDAAAYLYIWKTAREDLEQKGWRW